MSHDWLADFFNDADKVDIDALADWFAEDVDLRFGNNPPIVGKQAAIATMQEFYGTISAMRHRRDAMFVDGASGTQMSMVTYTDLAGRDVTVPVASYLRRTADGPLDRLWIYIDIAPLFAEAR